MNDSDVRKVKLRIVRILFIALLPAFFITLLVWMFLSFEFVSNLLLLLIVFSTTWLVSFFLLVKKYLKDYSTKKKVVETIQISKKDVHFKSINSTAMYCAQKYGVNQCAKVVGNQNSFIISGHKVSITIELYDSLNDGNEIEVSVAKYSGTILSSIIND